MEVRCSMESYDKVRQRAMYYSIDSIMYRSTLLYGIVRQSTAEGDVLFARQYLCTLSRKYASPAAYGIVRQSTSEGDVLFDRQYHV